MLGYILSSLIVGATVAVPLGLLINNDRIMQNAKEEPNKLNIYLISAGLGILVAIVLAVGLWIATGKGRYGNKKQCITTGKMKGARFFPQLILSLLIGAIVATVIGFALTNPDSYQSNGSAETWKLSLTSSAIGLLTSFLVLAAIYGLFQNYISKANCAKAQKRLAFV